MKKVLLIALIIFSCITSYSQVVKDSEVPANVKSVAATKLPVGASPSWVLDKNRNKYIASVMNTTMMRMVEIGMDGKWLGTTDGVLPEKTPAAVMATLKKEYLDKGYEASNFYYVQEPGVNPYYTIDLSSEDEELELTLDASGKILKKEAK